MPTQVRNPLNFRCSRYSADPQTVAYDDFQKWLAYGMQICWLGDDDGDPDSGCRMARPVTHEDVGELRGHFLGLVEAVIAALWSGWHEPGDGDIPEEADCLTVGNSDVNDEEETDLRWLVRLNPDAMSFELVRTDSDPVLMWLAYDAIANKTGVLKALAEARQTIAESEVWPEIVRLSRSESASAGQ